MCGISLFVQSNSDMATQRARSKTTRMNNIIKSRPLSRLTTLFTNNNAIMVHCHKLVYLSFFFFFFSEGYKSNYKHVTGQKYWRI